MDQEYRCNFELDRNGHPTQALLARVQEDGQWVLCDLEEFGPFCDRWDLAQWLLRALANVLAPRLR